MPKVFAKHAKPFAVIEWPDAGIEVVPMKWLNKKQDTMKYPANGGVPALLVRTLASVKPSWVDKPVKVHYSYDSYDCALKAAKKLENGEDITSNIDTDYDKPRKRRKNQRYVTTESEEGTLKETIKKSKKTEKAGDKNETEVRGLVAQLLNQASVQKAVSKSSNSKSKRSSKVVSKKESATSDGSSEKKQKSKGTVGSGDCSSLAQNMDGETVFEVPNQILSESPDNGTVNESGHSVSNGNDLEEATSNHSNKTFQGSNSNQNSAESNRGPATGSEIYNNESDLTTKLSQIVRDALQNSMLSSTLQVGSATPDPSSAGQSEIVAVISGGSIPSVNVDTTPMCQLVLASPTPNQSGSSNSFGSIEKKTLKESGSAENHKVLKSKKKKSMRIKKRKFTTALNVMQEHSFKLDQVQGMLRRILGKMFPEEVVRKPAGMPNIPLKDHDEFQQMEEYLRDDENFDALVNHLFGNVKYADNERNCVYISLDKLFTPELCATISWKGTKGEKYPFFNTKCLELLQCLATRLWDKDTDLNEVNKHTKRYFVISVGKTKKKGQEDGNGESSEERSEDDSDDDSEGSSSETDEDSDD